MFSEKSKIHPSHISKFEAVILLLALVILGLPTSGNAQSLADIMLENSRLNKPLASNNLRPATVFNGTPFNVLDGSPGPVGSQTIAVSGLGAVGTVSVTLTFSTVDRPDDLEFLLVHPDGVRNLEFLGDSGSTTSIVASTTITLADTGAACVPDATSWVTGTTYKPANWSAVEIPADWGGVVATLNHAGDSVACNTANGTFHFNSGASSAFTPALSTGNWTLYYRDDVGGTPGATSAAISAWSLTITSPTEAVANIGGRVVTSSGQGIGKAIITLSGGGLPEPVDARTSPFGYYNFPDVPVGGTYVITISPTKRYTFANPTRVVNLQDNVTDADFVSEE